MLFRSRHKNKVLVFGATAFFGAVIMNEVFGMKMAEISKTVTVVMFVLLAFVIPIFTLIFNRSDDVEKGA